MTNAACSTCDAVASPRDRADVEKSTDNSIILSLPDIHCGGCIAKVESALQAEPGVGSARVNLTLKRVSIETDGDLNAARLIGLLADTGYEAHELDAGLLSAGVAQDRSKALLMRLAVAGFAMMNVMLLSVAVWSGAADATRTMFHWVSAAIALPAIAYAAQPFFRNAYSALRVGRLNMDVPISLAIVLASGMSVYETMQNGADAYFDAALSLTFFLLIGRYLDMRTRNVARSAAQELAALETTRALLPDGSWVAIGNVAVGDLVRVLPGARVPVDGIIMDGASEIDRSLLTGETLPISVGLNAGVSTGEVNLTGPLTVRVTAAGSDSSLHRLAELVAVAETQKNQYTSLAERAARIYAPLVHILAFLAFAGWYWGTGDMRLSLNIAVAVLIITCPCALGLAVPAVTTAASGRLFRAGMLIKDATALERLSEVDTVVFDKTGTLTVGEPEAINLSDVSAQDLAVALALAAGSAHPLAMSLVKAGRGLGLDAANVTDIKEIPGFGIQGIWRDQIVRLGRANWVGAQAASETATYLQIADQPAVTFTFSDRLRDGADVAVAELLRMGKDIVLLSGDAPAPVAAIADQLGIAAWEAALLPADKADRIAELRARGHRVLMVGDGLNDTAALAAAHVSISPASALEAARVVSDIVLLGGSLAPIAEAVVVARLATRRIKENFAIAALYNMIAVPVALLGFATPLMAALAMSASSITVSLNALRLVRK